MRPVGSKQAQAGTVADAGGQVLSVSSVIRLVCVCVLCYRELGAPLTSHGSGVSETDQLGCDASWQRMLPPVNRSGHAALDRCWRDYVGSHVARLQGGIPQRFSGLARATSRGCAGRNPTDQDQCGARVGVDHLSITRLAHWDNGASHDAEQVGGHSAGTVRADQQSKSQPMHVSVSGPWYCDQAACKPHAENNREQPVMRALHAMTTATHPKRCSCTCGTDQAKLRGQGIPRLCASAGILVSAANACGRTDVTRMGELDPALPEAAAYRRQAAEASRRDRASKRTREEKADDDAEMISADTGVSFSRQMQCACRDGLGSVARGETAE
ncbi:hypothetical protein FQR65_LT20667 [Abscondita terminalis]|nr:hypothetical protein FQR65_LT20667 [Abscondita terminalis]